MKRPDDDIHDAELTALHDAYIWQANAAVSAGNDDVAWTLAQDFPDEALVLLVRGAEVAGSG